MCFSDEEEKHHPPPKKKLKKKPAKSASSTLSAMTVEKVLSENNSSKFSDNPEWFGFFAPGEEKPGMKTGRFSREKLKQQFGDVLCLPCVVARSGPPWCFKWCPCPNTPGHTADGAAHDSTAMGKARSQWNALKLAGREKDFWWQS